MLFGSLLRRIVKTGTIVIDRPGRRIRLRRGHAVAPGDGADQKPEIPGQAVRRAELLPGGRLCERRSGDRGRRSAPDAGRADERRARRRLSDLLRQAAPGHVLGHRLDRQGRNHRPGAARRAIPLRSVERVLRFVPRPGHAVFLRLFRDRQGDHRRGADREDAAYRGQAFAAPGPEGAGHRLRLGRPGGVPELELRPTSM